MRISYCTTCHHRLWQLKQTLKENLIYTKVDEVELCVLAYNDHSVSEYLHRHYEEFIQTGQLVVKERVDVKPFTCGYVKNFARELGRGGILFNLDADNYIDTAHEALLRLGENEILHHIGNYDIGLCGRIGVHRKHYETAGGYREVERADDGDFIRRLLWGSGVKMKLIGHHTLLKPIDNHR